MDIAIIGAGVSGLSCAHELERHGINPVIYERNSYIGEQIPHVGALVQFMDRPIKDAISYIKDQLGIEIKPLNRLNRITTNSPNKSFDVKGKLGYLINRGKDPDDLKIQIYSQLENSRIVFNEVGDYETLKNKYDYVVIANGSPTFSQELGCFNALFNGFVRGAVILGDFDPNHLITWFNKSYCNNGYAYLTPFSYKKAFLGLIVSDVNEHELETYWELFKHTENIKFPILEEFRINHASGFSYPSVMDNMLIVGGANGAVCPFLGFGQLGSISTGVFAARAIVNEMDYEILLERYRRDYKRKLQFRYAINAASNSDYDIAVSILRLPGIKQLIYNTSFNSIKHLSKVLKFLSKSQ